MLPNTWHFADNPTCTPLPLAVFTRLYIHLCVECILRTILDPCTRTPHSALHACLENVGHAVLPGGGWVSSNLPPAHAPPPNQRDGPATKICFQNRVITVVNGLVKARSCGRTLLVHSLIDLTE